MAYVTVYFGIELYILVFLRAWELIVIDTLVLGLADRGDMGDDVVVWGRQLWQILRLRGLRLWEDMVAAARWVIVRADQFGAGGGSIIEKSISGKQH
jgi:hypothetical protein